METLEGERKTRSRSRSDSAERKRSRYFNNEENQERRRFRPDSRSPGRK